MPLIASPIKVIFTSALESHSLSSAALNRRGGIYVVGPHKLVVEMHRKYVDSQ